MPHPHDTIEALIPTFRAELEDWVRIPTVSAEGYDTEPMDRCAALLRDRVEALGFDHAEVLKAQSGGHPYVVADHLHAGEAPTLLVYAHYDVQPPGDPGLWISPAYEPTERDGRLYGRGAVDDKAGIAVHLAALKAWIDAGTLPVNIKLLIDGEEEIGSPHLDEFLSQQRPRLEADCLIITDTENLKSGLPSLTVGLRGIAGATVRVKALEGPIHSGMAGGAVPDPILALVRILSRLTDDRGVVTIPEILEQVRPDPGRFEALPFDEDEFRKDCGLLDGSSLVGDPNTSVFSRIWAQPAITITAIESQPLQGSSNQVRPSAAARVSLRTVPNMDPEDCTRILCEMLRRDPPVGCVVEVEPEVPGPWWDGNSDSPAHDAARRALKEGFGVDAVDIACGGSIPFVDGITSAFGGIPALLMGLADPGSKAHAENESLNLTDFESMCRAAVRLYGYLGALDTQSLRG